MMKQIYVTYKGVGLKIIKNIHILLLLNDPSIIEFINCMMNQARLTGHSLHWMHFPVL